MVAPARHIRTLAAAVLTGLFLAVSLGAGSAGALGNVDQQQPATDSSVPVSPGLLQTFTVGTAGRLDGVQLTSPNGGTAIVNIYRVGATLPGVQLLPANISVAMMPGQPTVIGFAPISVSPGDVLGIAVGGVRSTSLLELAQASGDPYAAGTLYRVNSIVSFTPLAADLQFATFVTAPAPTTLALSTLKATRGVPTARLTTTAGGTAVAGKAVSFTLRKADGSTKSACSATTSASGVATCAVKWTMPKGGSMVAAFAGDLDYAGSSATVTQ